MYILLETLLMYALLSESEGLKEFPAKSALSRSTVPTIYVQTDTKLKQDMGNKYA